MQWRSAARALAVQAMSMFDMLGDEFARELPDFIADEPQLPEQMLQRVGPNDWESVREMALSLATGAWEARGDTDARLAAAMPNWKPERLNSVDRAVLRLAMHELTAYPQTPPAVVIDEAVELARAFGTRDSAAFVNGVLDAANRALRAAATQGA